MSVVVAPQPTQTCRNCGETKPLDEFPNNNKAGRLKRCRKCHSEKRRAYRQRQLKKGDPRSSSTYRQHLADRRRAYGHGFVDDAPSPEPARLLVKLLAESRRLGLDFDRAFPDDCAAAVADLCRSEREEWAEAFSALEPAWRAAYDRVEGGPGYGLNRTLLDALSDPQERHELLG